MSDKKPAVTAIPEGNTYFWKTLKPWILGQENVDIDVVKSIATADDEVVDKCLDYLVKSGHIELVEGTIVVADPTEPVALPAESDKPKAKAKKGTKGSKATGNKKSTGTKGSWSGRKSSTLSAHMISQVIGLKKSDKEALMVIIAKTL